MGIKFFSKNCFCGENMSFDIFVFISLINHLSTNVIIINTVSIIYGNYCLCLLSIIGLTVMKTKKSHLRLSKFEQSLFMGLLISNLRFSYNYPICIIAEKDCFKNFWRESEDSFFVISKKWTFLHQFFPRNHFWTQFWFYIPPWRQNYMTHFSI